MNLLTQNTISKRSFAFLSAMLIFITVFFTEPTLRASASAVLKKPKLSEYAVFADRIAISIDNPQAYSSDVYFEIYVSGKYLKKVKANNTKVVNIYDNGKYLKPNINYTVTVKPISLSGGKTVGEGDASSVKIKTDKFTYYRIDKGVKVYKLSGGKMVKIASASSKSYVKGTLATAKGMAIAGRSVKSCKGEYVKISSGEYSGYYIKTSDTGRTAAVNAQRAIVADYGRSMNGGSYVWGGASYRRTDCSGLTMQCYSQVGIDLAHSVVSQSASGKAVSLKNIQPGDLIILNYCSHVALYIGNGKMVHAMNSYDGIKVESISKLQYYHLDTIRRIIY